MRIGESCICSVTGATGFVTKFIGSQPIGRAPDGTLFKALSPRGRKADKRCLIRVVDAGEVLSGWLAAERLANDKFLVVDDDLNWHGAELCRGDVELGAEATP